MESNKIKEYKSLGNTIRQAVFTKKEAPTMLPDEVVEKLGLGDDDILNAEETLDPQILKEEIAYLQGLLIADQTLEKDQ